jgi:hypothetical protein
VLAMYTAIFRSDETVDAAPLYEEFRRWPNAKLNPVYQGNVDWTGICVYSRGGENHLEQLPALRALVERLGRKHVTGVTYFNLAPRSQLHRHRDMYGNLLFGISRLHIPIKTNPLALMEVEKIAYHLGLNEIWCLDTSGLHALRNDSDENRIHIVIDVKRNAATEKFFPAWKFPVVLHLARFVVIMSWKIVRDLVTRPATLLNRIRGLTTQY